MPDLYRHFDCDDRLLYIGRSIDALIRLMGHKAVSHWYDQIKKVTIEKFDNSESLITAERRAIVAEQPIFNRTRFIRESLDQEEVSHHARGHRCDGQEGRLNLISVSEARKRTNLSAAKQLQMIKDGLYPAPVRLGPRKIYFLESEISEWIAPPLLGKSKALLKVQRWRAKNPDAYKAYMREYMRKRRLAAKEGTK